MGAPADDIHQQILAHLKTILMFDRLTDGEIRKIYGICSVKRYDPDACLYRFGTPSDSLFILLDGRLVARTKAGVDVAYISPIGVVGEMGVITDQPRSADVVALDDSMGFEISKVDLISLFISDGAICRKILLNLVKILSNKLYDTNADIEQLRAEQAEAGGSQDQSDNIFLY